MNRNKAIVLLVVGIFLLATLGSVSACNGGCSVVSNEKKMDVIPQIKQI